MLRLCYNCTHFEVTEDDYGYYGEHEPGSMGCNIHSNSVELSDWLDREALKNFLEVAMQCSDFDEVND